MYGWLRTFWSPPPPPKDPDQSVLSDMPDYVKAKPRPERKGLTWKERLEEESRKKAKAAAGDPKVVKETPETSGPPCGPRDKATREKKRKASQEPESEEAVIVKKSTGRKGLPGLHVVSGVFNPKAPLNKSRSDSANDSMKKRKKKRVQNLGLRHAKLAAAILEGGKQERGKKSEPKPRSSDRKHARQVQEDESGLREAAGLTVEKSREGSQEGERSLLSPKSQELLKNLKKRSAGEVQEDDETGPPPRKIARHSGRPRTSGGAKDAWEDCIWSPEKVFGKDYKRRPGVPMNTALVKGLEHPVPKFDLRFESSVLESMKPPKPDIDWDWCDEEEVLPPKPPPAPFVPPQTQPQANDSAPTIPTTMTFGSNLGKRAGGSNKEANGGGEKKDQSAPAAGPSSFGRSDATQATVPMFGNIGSTPVDAQSQPTMGNMFSPAVQRPDRKRIVVRRNRSQDSTQGGAPLNTGSFGAMPGPTSQPPANPFGFGAQAGSGATPPPTAADSNPFASQKLVFSTSGAPTAPAPSFGQGGGLNNNSFSGNIPQFGGFGTQSQTPAPPVFNAMASPGFGAGNPQAPPAFGQPAPAFGGGGGGFTLGATDGQRRPRRRVRRTSPHR